MDNLQKLYQVLKETGLITSSYADFARNMSDDSYKQKVFKTVSDRRLFTQDYDSFNSTYSPKKVKIFGKEKDIQDCLGNKINKDYYEIVNTEDIVKNTDSPLEAAKRGKNTSMWLAIESVKKKDCDIVISAGNTGALLVISKLNLKMIENIDKPALSALWPNKTGMSVVLDLGANIECSSKNLIDFSIMGSSLFKSLYPNDNAKVALLNIGTEEIKGNEVIKETYQKIYC